VARRGVGDRSGTAGLAGSPPCRPTSNAQDWHGFSSNQHSPISVRTAASRSSGWWSVSRSYRCRGRSSGQTRQRCTVANAARCTTVARRDRAKHRARRSRARSLDFMLGEFCRRPPQLGPTLPNRIPGTPEPRNGGEIGHRSGVCAIPHLPQGAQTPRPARATQSPGTSHGYSRSGVCTASQRFVRKVRNC